MTRQYKRISNMSSEYIAKIKAMTSEHTMTTAAKKLGIKYAQLQYICKNLDIEFKKYGFDHPTAKFTDHEIWLVRQLAKEGLTQREIAEKMEMSHGYVSHVIRGKFRACLTTAN